MPFYLFHQNMRVFGGETLAYNARMKAAFGKLPIGYPTTRVLAAGFTEICNHGSAPFALSNMARGLDPGLTRPWTVAVGRTARMVKDPTAPPAAKKQKTYFQEYITMVTQYEVQWNGLKKSVPNEFQVLHWGKAVFLDSLFSGPSPAACFPVGGPGTLAPEALPYNAKLDSRGLAYIVGRVKRAGDPLNNRLLVVGFMHNMYGVGDRSGSITGLPRLAQAIYEKHSGVIDPDRDPCIVGGDFNVEPRRVGSRTSRFEPTAEEDSDGDYYRTTGSSVYDWWSCRVDSLLGSSAEIWPQTRKKNKPNNLSDHAGISLSLHQNMWW
ncbi:endonuclease/exonuclease/phosphatase family protein [Frankia sp. CNm7]|uniref:Endonuclease/exonuclease/phosphatase family protein n=1 Tax=Frankia nepalensis TaxID=1836974 RepID=A0A937REC7_9ACTN|nr:endonuclease/exonuclease/phosphatase family protein [Frankia nepalensis]MBL7500404.1 endonuclease/exonuclease/phosphatase family protein [Frankia nepalensis]MBL7508702.1 endonuclease/exonuclease/phosphatase family protein [Frankia nepalensis]MBL7520664.1 endonuclease/exonuclease/phosphatase family protein [Frankia nepalensis]MBL7628865.1 endonuclease/exonuclease/phosphatase family protein [Frankia nepalensis]